MSNAYTSVVRLLARREHSAYELIQKLVKKEFMIQDIQDAIVKCQELGLQSDARFAESLCRTRIRQGYGPARIRQDLQYARVDSEWIEAVLDEQSDHWFQYAKDVWVKKYQNHTNDSLTAKQKQFLLYRGFDMDTIRALFKDLKSNP